MRNSHLTLDFVLQSHCTRRLRVAGATVVDALVKEGGRGAVLCLEARGGTHSGVVICIDGMLPDRFYRTEGLPGRFVRADKRGVLTLVVHIERRTLIAIVPVI
jgi:hypothetical protein